MSSKEDLRQEEKTTVQTKQKTTVQASKNTTVQSNQETTLRSSEVGGHLRGLNVALEALANKQQQQDKRAQLLTSSTKQVSTKVFQQMIGLHTCI